MENRAKSKILRGPAERIQLGVEQEKDLAKAMKKSYRNSTGMIFPSRKSNKVDKSIFVMFKKLEVIGFGDKTEEIKKLLQGS